MKKIFYFILAAAAIVASCAKEPISEPVSPSGDGSSVFTGTIIQPGGIDEATKVSIIDQTSDPDNVYIKWTQYDQIYIIKKGSDRWVPTTVTDGPKVFYAASSEATTDFSGTPPTDWIAPGQTYAARYYGNNDVWKDYVLAGDEVTSGNPVNGIHINCNSNAEAAFLENMPLSCDQSSYDASNFRYNFTFSNAYAILQINVPSKLDFEDLYVCVNAQNVKFESGQRTEDSEYTLCLEGADAVKSTDKYKNKDRVTYFVPVSAGNYNKLTIVAAKNNAEVARMETYVGNVKNGSDSQYVLPQLYSNNIYPFDFCNTKTIEVSNTSDIPYELVSSNGIDYKVNVTADIAGDVYITTPTEGSKPANIYLNLRGHQIGTLYINGTESHVEGENGIIVNVEAQTSNSTFVVKPTLSITGLTVKKGSVVVEGTAGKKANVATITIPSEVTEQIKIDVSGVSTDESNRVEIVNNSTTPVVVVPDNVADQKSYKVTGEGEVTPVSKETVAKIGDAEYETLAAAISAASAGQTITLVSNIALDNPLIVEKAGITIDGNNFTIAVSDAAYWKNYTATKFGQTDMITVKADNFTLKNVTLDGKIYRGVSLCTTKSGKDVLYKNITYKGRGCGHYYGEAPGLVTFEGCKFNTQGYAVHFGGESAKDDDVEIKNCELNGWSSFGTCKSLTISDSHFGGANDEGKNGWLAVLRPYCPTTITNCTFSNIYLHKVESGYEYIGLGTGAATTVILDGCKIVNDAKQELVGAEIYSIVCDNGFDNATAQNGSVFAFDATGNATAGFTAGTFYAKDPAKIKVQTGYETYAIEGKTDIYGVRESEGNFVAKIGNTGYETLDEAFKAVQPNQTIEILKADTYTLPSPISSITIKGVEGVVFNAMKEYGQSVSQLHDVKFESVKFIFGSSHYTGFQHSESVTFTKCTFEGYFNSYGTMLFDQCTFNSPEGNYSMWCYAGDVTYRNCIINCKGKFVNVYNEGNTTADRPWKVVAEGCTFNSTSKNKAAFNIKATCGSKPLYYDVEIKNCTANGENWPAVSTSESLVVGSALWQVDDINSSVASKIKVTVDNNVVYQSPVTE